MKTLILNNKFYYKPVFVVVKKKNINLACKKKNINFVYNFFNFLFFKNNFIIFNKRFSIIKFKYYKIYIQKFKYKLFLKLKNFLNFYRIIVKFGLKDKIKLFFINSFFLYSNKIYFKNFFFFRSLVVKSLLKKFFIRFDNFKIVRFKLFEKKKQLSVYFFKFNSTFSRNFISLQYHIRKLKESYSPKYKKKNIYQNLTRLLENKTEMAEELKKIKNKKIMIRRWLKN